MIMLEYKNIFSKFFIPNWSEEIFVRKKVKDTVSWIYIISDLNGEEIFGTFYEKELQITNGKEFRVQKLIKKKGNKLCYMEDYDCSFNSWIDKKDVKEMREQFSKLKYLGGRMKAIKTTDTSNLVITVQEFNKLFAENFAVRLAQVNLATKADIADFLSMIDFDDNLKSLNKKVTSNRSKHVKVAKKITDLTNKIVQIPERRQDFLLGRMQFTGNDSYQNFLAFASMCSSLILDSNKKVNNWLSTGISS